MGDQVVKPREELARRRSSTLVAATAPLDAALVDAADVSKQKYGSPFDASLAAARKRSQEEKLWDIFATYALQLSSEDPTRMRVASVIKLLQDCGIIDSSNSDEAKMIEKEVSIVCESFLKSHPGERDSSKKLNFTAFLALLLHFAKMVGCDGGHLHTLIMVTAHCWCVGFAVGRPRSESRLRFARADLYRASSQAEVSLSGGAIRILCILKT